MNNPAPRLPPLVVDLDGTLSPVDTLHESLLTLWCHHPLDAIKLFWVLVVCGRAALKAKLATYQLVEADSLPLRADFVAWLEHQAASGRRLHLVSAANNRVVAAVAERLKIFTSWRGSSEVQNLKGANKAAYLAETFADGFAYAGDSAADIAVWRQAKQIVLVNASTKVTRRAERLGKPVEARFERRGDTLALVLKELRLHQWAKNGLVFLPILLAHHFFDGRAWLHAVYAFLALGFSASATYIVNDLFDLEADRAHATKRRRPLASGALGVASACALVPFMLAAGCILAVMANVASLGVLLAYLVLTLSYSFRFKRVPLFDAAIIGMLFTLRIVMGCAAADLQPSPWLLAFSVMLFFSLAMAKRQTEIAKNAQSDGAQKLAGRGYHSGDAILSLVYGVTTGVASLVILMLYTTNSVAAGLYRQPNWLLGVPLLLYLWQMRIWLLAHRGMLDDDPILFALKDRVSLLLGAGCVAVVYLAL